MAANSERGIKASKNEIIGGKQHRRLNISNMAGGGARMARIS